MATEKNPEPRKRFARRPKPPTLTDIARAGQAAGMLDIHHEPEPEPIPEPRKRPPHVDDEW